MAKIVFGEYAAFQTPGGIRFQKHNKMVSENSVPPEVVSYLSKKLTDTSKVEAITEESKPKFPMPSEEELARMKEESMQVPPELALTPEEEAARAVNPPAPLSEADFDPEPLTDEQLETLGEDIFPEDVPVQEHPSEVNADFMESVSIHTADLQDIAQALYERFGIYTVYINQLPRVDEVNPLTGEAFTKYHLGIAYQAAIRAQRTGVINRPHEQMRAYIDNNRAAAQNIRESFDAVPVNPEQRAEANSFGHRTSVAGTRKVVRSRIEHVYDDRGILRAVRRDIPEDEIVRGNPNGARTRQVDDTISSEPLVEPNIRGGKGSVIRPDW